MDKWLGNFSRWVALCGLSILLIFALFVVGEIVFRWLFDLPYEGVGDISRVLLPIVISCCFPISLLQRQHVTIQFLGHLLGRRWEASFNLLGGLLLTVFFALIAWQFTSYTLELQHVGEHTWVVQFPLAPGWWITTLVVWTCIPIQAMLTLATFHRHLSRRGPTQDSKEGAHL